VEKNIALSNRDFIDEINTKLKTSLFVYTRVKLTFTRSESDALLISLCIKELFFLDIGKSLIFFKRSAM
jgi:hypothetical protein